MSDIVEKGSRKGVAPRSRGQVLQSSNSCRHQRSPGTTLWLIQKLFIFRVDRGSCTVIPKNKPVPDKVSENGRESDCRFARSRPRCVCGVRKAGER